jgi:hypothetical protein
VHRLERKLPLVDQHNRSAGLPATRQRMDGANLDRLLAIRARMVALHDADAFDPFGPECVGRLVDE